MIASPMKVTFTKEIPGIGAKIRARREEVQKADKSLKMTNLAALAGISVPQWNRIEREEVGTTIETLRSIERTLEFSLDIEV